jgi:hypothetical protein
MFSPDFLLKSSSEEGDTMSLSPFPIKAAHAALFSWRNLGEPALVAGYLALKLVKSALIASEPNGVLLLPCTSQAWSPSVSI